MKLTIKQYVLIMLLILLTGLYTAFINYYFSQRTLTAQIITRTIKNDLSELSYLLSKHLRKEPIASARSLIDRKVANNPYIRAIAIFDDDKPLFSTHHKKTDIPSVTLTYNHNRKDDIYHALKSITTFESYIRYYQGKTLKNYSLVFYIEHLFILDSFKQARNEFILLFALLPIMILLFIWIFFNELVTKPLEILRQYAYYQSSIPKPFYIKEIEYIRASMVQTFYRLEQEKKDLYNLSITDPLSGLSNRYYLQERVQQIISESERNHKEFALLFLDLDHFKAVNDSLGHDVGDELLKSIAVAIQDILRINDVVARIGGDEFVIVLTHYKDTMELIDIIERIQKKLSKPWKIKSYPIQIDSSVGVTIYPKDGSDIFSLMKNADIAMYDAKAKGRKGYRFFTEELNTQTQEYIELTNTMRTALKNDEYSLYYQPQNDTQTGQIIGAEALIRWHNPKKGMIAPCCFIPIAESNGFIVELGKWILKTAIKQKHTWETQGINIKLAINVAVKQIQDPDFLKYLQELLTLYQVDNSQIILEITEYVFLNDSDSTLKIFEEIKALGIQISLDDFGTGYSSLSYLKTFPIDILKIDKIFLDDYESQRGAIFIETIITMAHTLKLTVVAEGVEHQGQLNYIRELNCNNYQGYICSKPVSIDKFNALLY